MKDVLFETDGFFGKARNAMMAPAGMADSLAWGQLWNACEAETKEKHGELTPGTEAFYQTVAQRFTEVVDHTQVVDGILQRSQIMRSQQGFNIMATSFMAEPTKQYNALVNAAYDYQNSGEHGKKAAGKRLARTVTTFFAAAAVNAAVQSMIDALRDDEKERDYWERFFEAYTGIGKDGFSVKDAVFGNLGSAVNPAGMIPYVRDALSITEGYDVARMDMESVADVVKASGVFLKALGGEGKLKPGVAAAELAAEAARLFGIPISNFKRDALAIAKEIMAATGGYEARYRLLKISRNFNYSSNSTEVLNLLYEAMCNDPAAYEIIKKDLIRDDALKTESTTTSQRIKDSMKRKYNKDLQAGKAPRLSQQRKDELGIYTGYTPKQESTSFKEEDLSNAQYARYDSEKAKTYRSVVDEISGYSGWAGMDGAIKDAVSAAADTYAKETALANNSGGKYTEDTKWVRWASGGGAWRVSPAEATFFHVLYEETPGDKNSKGDTVNGSKKKNVLAAAEEFMPHLTKTELEYLEALYWTPTDKDLKERKENGWQ